MAGQKDVQGSTHAWGTPWGHSSPPPVGSHPGGVWGAEPQRGGGETQQRGHRSTTAAFAARGEETRTRGRAHTRTALRPGPRGGCRRGGPAPVPVPVEEAARCGAVRRALTRRWRRSGARRWRCGAEVPGPGGGGGGAGRGGAGRLRTGAGTAGSARAARCSGCGPERRRAARDGAARSGSGWNGVGGAGCGLRAGVRADRSRLCAHRQRAPSVRGAGARAAMCPRCTHTPCAHSPACMATRWLCTPKGTLREHTCSQHGLHTHPPMPAVRCLHAHFGTRTRCAHTISAA